MVADVGGGLVMTAGAPEVGLVVVLKGRSSVLIDLSAVP